MNGRAVRPAEFSHGMSNTALFSERVTGDERSESFDPFRDIFAVTRLRGDQSTASMDRICQQTASTQPEAEFSFQGATWLLGGYSNTWYNHVRTPNSVHPDCAMGPKIVDGGPSILSARSLHPGGVNVMMADASVTFTSSSIDGNVWKALGTRNGPSD